jgi:hypothetical protein
MLGRLKFNIEVLVEEILDQIPEHIWQSDSTTFLDPAIGGGQFVVAIERKLRKYGHSSENIAKRVFGYEDNILRVNYAINKHKLVGNYQAKEFLKEEFNMKFAVVLGNPPYQGKAELHQKFFNKAVDIVEDGGYVAFIQPATQYQNKKENIRANAKDMIDNVKKYDTSVRIISGEVFEAANIFTDLAITVLRKKEDNKGKLRQYQYKNDDIVYNLDVIAINKQGMDTVIYSQLSKNILQACRKYGDLQSLVSKDLTVDKFYIQKVRGNIGKHDFYSVISAEKKYWTMRKEHDYGLVIDADQKDSLTSYLTSYVARFALSIYKFNGNNHMGELRSIPLVPFDRIWNDKLLCEYFGITDAEYQEILRCLPDYYGLGDNLS